MVDLSLFPGVIRPISIRPFHIQDPPSLPLASVDDEVLRTSPRCLAWHGRVLTSLGVTVTAMQMIAGNFLPAARFSQQPVSGDLVNQLNIGYSSLMEFSRAMSVF